MDNYTIEKLLKKGHDDFRAAGFTRLDAEVLLAHVLHVPRVYLYTHATELLATTIVHSFLDLQKRRLAGEPIAYLVGKKEFWSLELEINADTLVPRPETELLVQLALTMPKSPLTIADLGVGSGAIAIALAVERPMWKIIAIDISRAALCVAARNINKYAITNIQLIESTWCQPLQASSVDAIVTNPPYIAENDIHLAELSHEPMSALVAGPDGLDAIRIIIRQGKVALKPGGLLLIEHGFNQASQVRELLRREDYAQVTSYRDLNGIFRVSGGYS